MALIKVLIIFVVILALLNKRLPLYAPSSMSVS